MDETSILALALNTETFGWAWGDGRGVVLSASDNHEKLLALLSEQKSLQVYFYADKGKHESQLKAACKKLNIPCEGVSTGEIKKFWTGNGNAAKDAMVDEAVRRGCEPIDDNEANALALLHFKGGAGIEQAVPADVAPLATNVVQFPYPKRPRYSIDVISERVIDGYVLIEACIPVAALDALMAFLEPSPKAS